MAEAAKITAGMRDAIKWLRDRGSDCAVARVKGGGRIYLAAGEHATFMPWTAKALVDAGLAEYVDSPTKKAVRFRLTEAGRDV